jgi:hypothetical protein
MTRPAKELFKPDAPAGLTLVEINPNASAIVPVPSTCIAPTVFLAVLPPPVVVVDAELETRVVITSLFDAPTITFVIAYDGC